MSKNNDGIIYWPDPADETTRRPTRGSNGCEWCVINLGRGDCTYITDLANCPLSNKEVRLLNNIFIALQQRLLSDSELDIIRAILNGKYEESNLAPPNPETILIRVWVNDQKEDGDD